MHYFAAAVIGPEDGLEAVDNLLMPHEERWDDKTDEGTGVWDWWVIGGRWTGRWSEYDPTADPENFEECFLCHGTGIRPGGREQFGEEWFKRTGGCNACEGKGRSLKHASDFKPCPDDRKPVSVLLNNPGVPVPHTIFFPDGSLIERPWRPEEQIEDDQWAELVRSKLEPWSHRHLVIVDYHS